MKKSNLFTQLLVCISFCVFFASCYDETKKASIKISVGSSHLAAAQTYVDEMQKTPVLLELGMQLEDIEALQQILKKYKQDIDAIQDIFFSNRTVADIPSDIMRQYIAQERVKEPIYYYLTELNFQRSEVLSECQTAIGDLTMQYENQYAGAALMGMSAAIYETYYRGNLIMEVKLRTFSDYPQEDPYMGPKQTAGDGGSYAATVWSVNNSLIQDVYKNDSILKVDSVQYFTAWINQHVNKLKKEGILFDAESMYQAPNAQDVENYMNRVKREKAGH